MPPRKLLGRETELHTLESLVQRASAGAGGALVVEGAAGIGKSALVAEGAASAVGQGIHVITTVGVESEENVAYAGLHQLLYQFRDRINGLPVPQRTALRAALGLSDERVSAPHLVGLAVLTLMSDATAKEPLLVVVEDAHWMDRASLDVVGFVARRIESDPIGLIIVTRGTDDRLEGAGLPVLSVNALTEQTSSDLLHTVAPTLTRQVRRRLLEEAAGNPLALTELPVALNSVTGPSALTMGPLPLTERLERTFAARVSNLPDDTRTVLLVAALNGDGTIDECLAAAGRMLGTAVDVNTLAFAVDVGLLEAQTMRFQHPLMRSAIHHGATAAQRQAAHAALANELTGQPDRRAWHAAAATSGRDERAAQDLHATADRALRRGAIAAALAALMRSAELTENRSALADRLVRAAELALESGQYNIVDDLLTQAGSLELSVQDRGRAAYVSSIRKGFWTRGEGTATAELAELAVEIAAKSPALGLRMLSGTILHCLFGEPGQVARDRVTAAANRMPVESDNPLLVALRAFCAPVDHGGAALEALQQQEERLPDSEIDGYLGTAALLGGAPGLAWRLATRSVDTMWAQGRLPVVTGALSVQAASAARLGDVRAGYLAAEECAQLEREIGQPVLAIDLLGIRTQLGALCGDPLTEEWAAEAERAALPLGLRTALAFAQMGRGTAALCQGRYGDAFGHLRRVFDPADPAFHPWLRLYALSELVEAGVRSDSADVARDIVEELTPLSVGTPAPALLCGLRLSRAMLSPPEVAEMLYREALDEVPADWPFERARLHLALGAWLRRQRRSAESRTMLQAAREVFDALGASAWSERARQELRAGGTTSRRQDPTVVDQLTSTELRVAQLAAQGLTNRQIGERLYVSPRTVSTHLQRMFPKLGVASRGEIAALLVGTQQRHPL